MFNFKFSEFYKVKIFFLGFLTFACLAQGSIQPELNLYQYKLENLFRFSRVNTQSFAGQPSIWVSFQPNCTSCTTQLKSLSCLPGHIRKVALGIRGTQDELAKILRPLTFEGEKLLSSPDFSRDFSMAATPTVLIVNAEGQLQKKVIGVTDCETLNSYFENNQSTGELK
jgi:hypothetical protein